MSWVNAYKEKITSAAEAVRLVQSGDRVYYGGEIAGFSCVIAAVKPVGLAAAAAVMHDY